MTGIFFKRKPYLYVTQLGVENSIELAQGQEKFPPAQDCGLYKKKTPQHRGGGLTKGIRDSDSGEAVYHPVYIGRGNGGTPIKTP